MLCVFVTAFIIQYSKGSIQNETVNLTHLINNVMNIFEIRTEETRINELKEKLDEINKYVLNNDDVEKIVLNATKDTDLNQTDFFKALQEKDKFDKDDEIKSLYLKIKEKMNRDDMMKILSDRGDENVIKAARRTLNRDYGGNDDEIIDTVVDKMLSEKPRDDHRLTHNDSTYWDPKGELNDLNEYHQHDGRRIYKGERTTVLYYPFMATIHVLGRFWCGGSVYWSDLILTSAACLQLTHNNRFFRENPKLLQVRVGSNHSRIGGEMIDALEVFFHPTYDPKTLRNNIAIIRLRRHLYFDYHRVPKKIDISYTSTAIPDTAEVLLLGWGVTKISQKLDTKPIYLQKKFLPVYPNTFCKEVYGDKFVPATMFCAGTLTTGEGACDHDAGGPAVMSGRLVGIISFGPTVCGYPNAPTVFTLIGAYSDWIENVRDTMPTYYTGKKRTTTTTISPLFSYFATWDDTTPPPETTIVLKPLRAIQMSRPVEDEDNGWSIEH